MTRRSVLAIGVFVVSRCTVSWGRWSAPALLALVGILVATGSIAASTGEGAVLRIQVIGSGRTIEGTCFLIHQERREHDVVHYFLTSSHLLDPEPLGDRRAASLRLRMIVDGSNAIETSGHDVVFSGGSPQALGLAIVKAVSTNISLVPIPVTMEPPAAGDEFVVRGHQGIALIERVRFRSTMLVVGDRTAADVAGLAGAPAMVEGSAFGVVCECSSSRVPVITLLSAARNFLARTIPGWSPTASATSVLTRPSLNP